MSQWTTWPILKVTSATVNTGLIKAVADWENEEAWLDEKPKIKDWEPSKSSQEFCPQSGIKQGVLVKFMEWHTKPEFYQFSSSI